MMHVKIKVENLQEKEKTINSRVKSAIEIVTEANATSRTAKSQLRYLDKYLNSLKQIKTRKLDLQNTKKHESSPASHRNLVNEQSVVSSDLENEKLRKLINRLTIVDKNTAARMTDIKEHVVKMQTVAEVFKDQPIEKLLEEYDRGQIHGASLSKSINSMTEEIHRLQQEKQGLDLDLRKLQSSIMKENTRKMTVKTDDKIVIKLKNTRKEMEENKAK